LQTLVHEALPELEEAGDDLALNIAYWAAGWAALNEGRIQAALPFLERSLSHCENLPVHYEQWVLRLLVSAKADGTTPASEFLAWLSEWEATHRTPVSSARRAVVLSMTDR